VVASLQQYKGSSVLRRTTIELFIKTLDPKDLQTLKAQMEGVDTDHSGMIEVTELQRALKNSKLSLTVGEAESIIAELDSNRDKRINYLEFLAATVDVS
jgi:Ca2+-binding EF-hand superfamily protein